MTTAFVPQSTTQIQRDPVSAVPTLTPTVIAVCHQKGGVAKTTTSISLGASLAELGFPTLLIDLDPQPNMTVGLGLNPNQLEQSVADVLLGAKSLADVAHDIAPDLRLAPSNPDMLALPGALYGRQGYEFLLRERLRDSQAANWRYAIIDCPPSLGPLTLTALSAAHLVIVPTQCEFFSMHALNGVFKLIRLVRARTNPNLRYRLLITMFDLRGNQHSQGMERLRAFFADSLLQTTIGVDSQLRQSQLLGKPITEHASSTRAAKQYRQLAQEILRYV
jgi:chromosome partitioning protein